MSQRKNQIRLHSGLTRSEIYRDEKLISASAVAIKIVEDTALSHSFTTVIIYMTLILGIM